MQDVERQRWLELVCFFLSALNKKMSKSGSNKKAQKMDDEGEGGGASAPTALTLYFSF